jgi:Asp-tRNA(Asn)/Glu-tRNA(Gln) amidotransferase C subunit
MRVVKSAASERPTAETVRHLAALHGLRFSEERLEELAGSLAAIQEALTALEPELDGVEPIVTHHLRQE